MERELQTLSRRELVNAIAAELGMTQAKTAPIVHRTIERIADALWEKRRVELRGLGVFSIRGRDARFKRDPRTGEPVTVKARQFVVFKPSKSLQYLPRDTNFSVDDPMMTKLYTVMWELPLGDHDPVGGNRTYAKHFIELMRSSRFGGVAMRGASPNALNVYTNRDGRDLIIFARRVNDIVFNGEGKVFVRFARKARDVSMSSIKTRGPQSPADGVSVKLYFEQPTKAKEAADALRASGCTVQYAEDQQIVVANGPRKVINRAILKYGGSPVAASMSGTNYVSDWAINFGTRRRVGPVATHALRAAGLKVSLTGNTVTVFNVTHDYLDQMLRRTKLDISDIDPKREGSISVYEVTHRTPQDVGYGRTQVEQNPKYKDPNTSVKDLFYQYVVDFTSEVGATKAADALRRIGVDILGIAGGTLLLGLKAVLERSTQSLIQKYEGRVKQRKPIKKQSGGGVSGVSGFFNRFKRSAPTSAPSQAPVTTTAPARTGVTPPTGAQGYKIKGKEGRRTEKSKGIFSFAMEDYTAKHNSVTTGAVNREHAHIVTFTKNGERHSHMKKANGAPYTLVTNLETGEQRRLYGHTDRPIAQATANKIGKVVAVSGGYMIKLASKALKLAAELYAAKVGYDLVTKGPDFVIVDNMQKASQILKYLRGRRFSHDEKQNRGVACADYIAVAYAVMDALSDTATRAIIDALTESGIRAAREGASRVVARIRDPEQTVKIRAIADRFKAKLKFRRVGGANTKIASFDSIDDYFKDQPKFNKSDRKRQIRDMIDRQRSPKKNDDVSSLFNTPADDVRDAWKEHERWRDAARKKNRKEFAKDIAAVIVAPLTAAVAVLVVAAAAHAGAQVAVKAKKLFVKAKKRDMPLVKQAIQKAGGKIEKEITISR